MNSVMAGWTLPLYTGVPSKTASAHATSEESASATSLTLTFSAPTTDAAPAPTAIPNILVWFLIDLLTMSTLAVFACPALVLVLALAAAVIDRGACVAIAESSDLFAELAGSEETTMKTTPMHKKLSKKTHTFSKM
mmetsp:Transcript_26058/g.45113  ORF Transcript_26058/g.45113 Transcript_26058/m.45113 type:complete len:136 (-) Transcript_26058:43-450(-)